MRTATAETVRALRKAIGSTGYGTWARSHGLPPATVTAIGDALHGKPMSARRENTLRELVGLPALRWQTIELMEGQRVVTETPPRRKMRRAMTMEPDIAVKADAHARRMGYTSAGAFAAALLIQELPLD